MDSDDDLPPPLEDMSSQLETQKKAINNGGMANVKKTQDHVEEVRLAPKKQRDENNKVQSSGGIAPKDDDFDFDQKKQSQQANEEKKVPAAAAPVAKKKKDSGFGGFSAGFLNSSKPKKQAVKKAPEPEKKAAAPVEDFTHVKAKAADERLKIDEVQDAMSQSKNFLESSKDKWMSPEFFEKLAKNPKLLKAFTDPQYMQLMTEMGKDPKACVAKYGHMPEFREIMQEFSAFMGDHFTNVADKEKEAEAKKKEEEEKKRLAQLEEMKKDPVYNIMESDPRVKEFLADEKVKEILDHLRFKGALDLHSVLRTDPPTGQKLMYLIQKGVLNTHQQAP